MRYLWLLLIPFLLFAIRSLFIDHKEHNPTISQKRATAYEALDPNDPNIVEHYIISVIKYGSDRLGYPTKMEGGYVSDAEAKKIAAYLATLQGLRPSHPEWVEEGAALYYGNCVGCHQKGVKSFPDLTRKPLLGIEKLGKIKQKE